MKQGKALIVLLVYIAAMAGAGIYLLNRGDLEDNAPQEVEREGGSKIPSTVYRSDGNSSSETESSNESESSIGQKTQLIQGTEPDALFVYQIRDRKTGGIDYKLIDQFTGETLYENSVVTNLHLWAGGSINSNDLIQYHGPTRSLVIQMEKHFEGPGAPYNPDVHTHEHCAEGYGGTRCYDEKLPFRHGFSMYSEESDSLETIITDKTLPITSNNNWLVHPEKPVMYILATDRSVNPSMRVLYEVPLKPNATPKELARFSGSTNGLALRRNATLLVTTQEMPHYERRNPVSTMEVGVNPLIQRERETGVPNECNGCLKLWFISTKTGQTSEVYMTSMNEPYTNGVENLSESAHWYGSYFTLVDVTRDKATDISVPNMGVHNYYMYWSGDENYLTMQIRPPNAVNGAGNRVVIFDNSTNSFVDTPLKEDFFLMDFAPSSRFLLYSTRSDRSLKLYDIETKESRTVLRQKEEASELGGSWVPLLSSSQ